ncbi:IS110 family transposase [Brevibacillus reuszeri]|uniref:IS110 family transposase n=1 Tax=Brevibacillus reuszeri TaxID=54915 RepID=UPI000CCC63AB|nr:IS110 family transposase [Brevibacillus reuszeri]
MDLGNPFLSITDTKHETSTQQRAWYPFYVGVDIGADFHVASCISIEQFRTDKAWKRTKTMKFNADSKGIHNFLNALKDIQIKFGLSPKDFFILLEPTGGHYSYLLMRVLLNEGYELYQVENKAVKDFRERQLGITEKSDDIDARIMSYMGWHKSLHPDMKSVRIVKPATPTQVLFRTLTRDRWLLSTQLTRRKNQVQQLFAVTHPDLKSGFKKLGTKTVFKLVLKYPTAQKMALATQAELRQAIIEVGGKNIATKASEALSNALKETLAITIPHLEDRQTWLIEEAIRIEEAIEKIDQQIATLLQGDKGRNISPHPYNQILKTFPVMSDVMACTLIGAIGDVERFSTYLEFKKYLGVSAESKTSGTSVSKTRMTYEGIRDTRRILFLMSLLLLAPNTGPTVFKAHYDRLVGRGMNKRKAIGHVCGKLATVIYSCLKQGVPYDPRLHAKKCGVEWNEAYEKKMKIKTDIGLFELEADKLAEETIDTE